MWRYLAGACAAILLTVAGMLFWSSQAGTTNLLRAPPVPKVEPLGIVDVAAPLEASERTREQRRFSRYDADENGAVSRDEYLQSRKKSYARLDLDGDGKLSFEEYAAKAVKKFASADRDRTGVLTPAEFLATRVARKPGARANCPPPPLRANSGNEDADS